MSELGVPLAAAKTEGPINKLGVELESVQQCSRLPMKKLHTLRQLLLQVKAARKLTLRELQILTLPVR